MKKPKKTGASRQAWDNIVLANQKYSLGTVISSVHPSSALSKQVLPGDRILENDEEDVSQLNMTEISKIISRKYEFEKKLLVLLATEELLRLGRN